MTKSDQNKGLIDNSFFNTLREIRGGESLAELSRGLAEVVAQVRATHQAGTLTYRIKVSPASKGAVAALVLADEVKIKLPAEERASSFFFATEDNRLQRDNPLQASLDLKVAAAPEELTRKAS